MLRPTRHGALLIDHRFAGLLSPERAGELCAGVRAGQLDGFLNNLRGAAELQPSNIRDQLLAAIEERAAAVMSAHTSVEG